MSKYMMFRLEKSKHRKLVDYMVFSTNTPAFRKVFNISIDEATVTFDTFQKMIQSVISHDKIESKFDVINDKWELNSEKSPIISIGVGGKHFDFSDFLLKDKMSFELKRKDGKKHLEKKFSNIRFKEDESFLTFNESYSKWFFFRPPDNFSKPFLVTLRNVSKSGGRNYCYVNFIEESN